LAQADLPSPSRLFPLALWLYLPVALAGVAWMASQQAGLAPGRFFRPALLAGDLVWGLAAGGVLSGVWWLLARRVAAAQQLERRLRSALGVLRPGEASALAVVSGFAEELLFRGAVLAAWGWPASVALFALLHLAPPPAAAAPADHTPPGTAERPLAPSLLWMAFAVLAGGAFAALVLVRGTLLPAVLAHVTVNAIGLNRLTRAGGDPEEASRGR
jgi:membrane protease YdiL (CAAX protease family)